MLPEKKVLTVEYSSTRKTDVKSGLINVAVIGCGYWGPSLVRNLAEIREVKVCVLCDLDSSKAYSVARDYVQNAKVEVNYQKVLDDPGIHAVVIATPAKVHYPIAKKALSAGKHVFVEKPLAMSQKECNELMYLAEKSKLVLMVGHIFLYNPAVRKIKGYIDQALFGDIFYIHSSRLNLGRIQEDINVLWSFAAHDISTFIYWLGQEPLRVTSKGFDYLKSGVEDVVFMTMEFPGGIQTHSHVSWLNPKKVREVTIVGSERMLVYNDVALEDKIQIYHKNVKKQKGSDSQYERSFAEFQMKSRYGDVIIPYFPFSEPLQLECQHFVECIKSGALPLTSGEEGLRVVSVLEAAQQSLEKGSMPVEVLHGK